MRNYFDPQYKAWILSVFKRDKFKCRFPNCLCHNKKKKIKLNAHHIRRWADNPELRYSIDNGITLCKDAHKKVTGNEDAYVGLFQSLVSGKSDSYIECIKAKYGPI